jgi:ABC-type Na+ efflux pump permease subunit
MGFEWTAIRALMRRDLAAIRRSRAIMLPMIMVPTMMLILLPASVSWLARGADPSNATRLLGSLPESLADPINALPPDERLIVLVNQYMLAPLFLIVPLMVSAVLAADAFAGEKERKTLESLLHLPIREKDIYVAKLLTAFVPAVMVSWIGFLGFALVVNTITWSVIERILVPDLAWTILILWVAPATAALGLGVMIWVSARSRNTQEANQLGGAVVLPLLFLVIAQSTGLLVAPPAVALILGAFVWLGALVLARRGARKFTRDRLAAQV